jgi:hypothetical protein
MASLPKAQPVVSNTDRRDLENLLREAAEFSNAQPTHLIPRAATKNARVAVCASAEG